jgi:5-methylcytosine-specific restriction endonuclease McrA
VKLTQLRGPLQRLKPKLAFLNDDKAAVSRARDRQHEYRAWYKLPRWKAVPHGSRWRCLARDLFTCQMCGWLGGNQTYRLVADHKKPHRGDEALFWDDGNLWCLCKTCHDGTKQSEERGGWVSQPDWLKPSAISLTIVCGPPASGKSAYVMQRAEPGDVVIDLDLIVAELAGAPMRHDWSRDRWLGPAMRRRNEMLGDLRNAKAGSAWFIVSAPRASDRQWWKAKLKADRVIMLAVPEAECMRRATAQGTRESAGTVVAVRQWWSSYQPDAGDEHGQT